MKYLRKFEKFETQKINENIGVALFMGMSVAWLGLAPHIGYIYNKVKDWWKGKKLSDKYNKTGKTEKVITKLPEDVSYIFPISQEERESGLVETKLTQYEDDFGNIYWGYDHLHTEKEYADFEEHKADLDMYTAMFKEEDYNSLKEFLQDGQRYSGKGSNKPAPKPVEMVFREDWNKDSF